MVVSWPCGSHPCFGLGQNALLAAENRGPVALFLASCPAQPNAFLEPQHVQIAFFRGLKKCETAFGERIRNGAFCIPFGGGRQDCMTLQIMTRFGHGSNRWCKKVLWFLRPLENLLFCIRVSPRSWHKFHDVCQVGGRGVDHPPAQNHGKPAFSFFRFFGRLRRWFFWSGQEVKSLAARLWEAEAPGQCTLFGQGCTGRC